MTKHEYTQLKKAIQLLMEDEPRNEEEIETFQGGFTAAMEILDDMRRAHAKRSNRIHNAELREARGRLRQEDH